MKERRTDMVGKVIGQLTVLEFSHVDRWRRACWRCLCTCSKKTTVTGCSLRRGPWPLSCGHLQNDFIVKENKRRRKAN